MVRVRFAPSPTGHLHIGAARTALFNWLFARHNRGLFILRIEDTDVSRSSQEMTEGILQGLKWLGLDWDEGPIFQSSRSALYQSKAEELLRKGWAYSCFCRPEEISARKKKARESGDAWKRDRCCVRLTEDEKRRFESMGRSRAVKFLVPESTIEYTDMIHGPISVSSETIEDFVLLRSDGFPTYHLSVVVDDIDLGITHIIRGDDHISNTPKQLLLYEAFEVPRPEFAHLALILGPDKRKLSKRHGETSVLQFREDGYLALAVVNFLAQMSWKPGEEERIYDVEEMIDKFSLDRMSKSSPIFDPEKLGWLNGQLISDLDAGNLLPLIRDEFKKQGLWSEGLDSERRTWFIRLIGLLKQRNRTIRDFVERGRPFLSDNFEMESEGRIRYLSDPKLPSLIGKLKKDFSEMDDFRSELIEKVLRQRAEKEGEKAALFIHALRMLVLGMKVSPGIFEVLELIGKDKTLERMGRIEGVGPL